MVQFSLPGHFIYLFIYLFIYIYISIFFFNGGGGEVNKNISEPGGGEREISGH